MRPIVRERILNRDGRKCAKCGNTENLEIDHIVPLKCGGKHSEDNFQVLCRTCNRKKSSKNDFGELMKKYFIIDRSPEYILMADDFPIGVMGSKTFSNFTKFVFDEHAKVFNLR